VDDRHRSSLIRCKQNPNKTNHTYTGIGLNLVSKEDGDVELLGDPLETRQELIEFLRESAQQEK